MKTLRALLVFSGLVALASAANPAYERFGHNDRLPLANDPAKINLIASSRDRAAAQPLTVSLTVSALGGPSSIRVLAGTGDEKLDQQCIATLQQLRFAPTVAEGVAVSSERTLTVSAKYRR